MFILGCKMRMGMATGMNMAMVPFPAFVPVSTLQNPANTNGQYPGFYPPGYFQAEACHLPPFFYVLLSNHSTRGYW